MEGNSVNSLRDKVCVDVDLTGCIGERCPIFLEALLTRVN
jgi:hypothetical protein